MILLILSFLGFCISLYAYYVEQKTKSTPGYKAICDISDYVSCSKPVTSEYASLLFISNAIVGMLFYAIVIVLTLFEAYQLLLIAAIIATIASIILAYLLFVKIRALCLLCLSIYIINALILLVLILQRY